MEIEKLDLNDINKIFDAAQARPDELEEIRFAGQTYRVHQINFHYSSGFWDSGYITLEDGTKWYDPESRISPAYFINWKTNDRVILLDLIERSHRGHPKYFYNLENGEVCKLERTFR